MPSYNDKVAADYKKKKAGLPRTVAVTDPADPNSPQASLYNAAKALTREPMTPGTVPQPLKSKTGVPLDPSSPDSPQGKAASSIIGAAKAWWDNATAGGARHKADAIRAEQDRGGVPYINTQAQSRLATPDTLFANSQRFPKVTLTPVPKPAVQSTIGYRPDTPAQKPTYSPEYINEYQRKLNDVPPTINSAQMPLRPDAQQAPVRLSDAQLPRSTEDDRPAPPIAGVQLRNVTLTPEQIASRRSAVEREMMQRNFIRNKQTPFAKRDPITGEVDPELQAMWFKNDEKFAADRAYALGQPQRLGTAAAGRQTDLETLAELKRQREAEANRAFAPITEQPSFNAAVQYRDPALQEEAFKKAQDEYGATAHRSVAESQARIADLDRRIAEYIDRTTQPLPANPTPSPLAASDRAARRDVYTTESGKMGEKVTEQQAYVKQLDSERRAAAIRGEQLRNREDPQQELTRAMVGTEIDKIKSGRVPEEYKRGLESAATSPEGLANLGAQTIEGIFQSVSDNGAVTGTGASGDAKNALGLSRMLRDQVVGNLEKLRSNPTARASALAFKNQLETKLGVSGEFKADTSFFTSVVDRLLGLGNPMAQGPSALTQPERQELAATLNDIYKRLSDLASEQQ